MPVLRQVQFIAPEPLARVLRELLSRPDAVTKARQDARLAAAVIAWSRDDPHPRMLTRADCHVVLSDGAPWMGDELLTALAAQELGAVSRLMLFGFRTTPGASTASRTNGPELSRLGLLMEVTQPHYCQLPRSAAEVIEQVAGVLSIRSGGRNWTSRHRRRLRDQLTAIQETQSSEGLRQRFEDLQRRLLGHILTICVMPELVSVQEHAGSLKCAMEDAYALAELLPRAGPSFANIHRDRLMPHMNRAISYVRTVADPPTSQEDLAKVVICATGCSILSGALDLGILKDWSDELGRILADLRDALRADR